MGRMCEEGEVGVRVGVAGDAEALCELRRVIVGEGRAFAAGPEDPVPDVASTVQMLHLARLTLVAVRGHCVVGWLALRTSPLVRLRHRAEVELGVAPSERRHGVGRTLLEQAQGFAAADPWIEQLTARCRADNVEAAAFFERAGFVTEARLEHGLRLGAGRYVDVLLLRRKPI